MRFRPLVILGLIMLGLAACQTSASPLPSDNPPGTWQLKFDAEFNGDSLNTTDWSTGWHSHGITQPVNPRELECYDPANVRVSDGILLLSLTRRRESCGGTERSYVSGMVNTDGKFEFTYGFMEAHIWLPGAGFEITNWPAFWATGQNWPEDREIDVMEGLSGQACWHFIYPGDNPGGCAHGVFTSGWHTFGADWESKSITYYYDGRVVGEIKSGITSAPMYLILDYATANEHSGPVQAPQMMRVDYVRVWQHAS
jgi:beta-glucanase (GH16 family)